MASILTKFSGYNNVELSAFVRKSMTEDKPLEKDLVEEVFNRLQQQPKDQHDHG